MLASGTLRELLTEKAPIEEIVLRLGRDLSTELDASGALAALDDLAAPLTERGLATLAVEEAAQALAAHLHERHGFTGETDDYYDPRNSDLAEVLRRRRGLPIMLSIVYMAVGRRAGLSVAGIGFPGHFLVRVGGTLFQDPFQGGRLIGPDEFEELARRFAGTPLDERMLEPADDEAIVVRVIRNLRRAYAPLKDLPRLLVLADHEHELTGSVEARRDRGLYALALGAPDAAAEDLQAWLEANPDVEPNAQLRTLIEQTRRTRGKAN